MKKNMRISMLAFLIISLALGTHELLAKTKKKNTHIVRNANIIVKGEPILFTRGQSDNEADFYVGTVMYASPMLLHDQAIAFCKGDVTASVEGTIIAEGTIPSVFKTSKGQFSGWGKLVLSASSSEFTPDDDSTVRQEGELVVPVAISDNKMATVGGSSSGSDSGSKSIFKNPYDSVGISLAGPSASVSLDLSYTDQSIDLNGGTATLLRDLKFADDRRFLHTGTVNLNGKTLTFGGQPMSWDTDIVWRNASDLQLNSKTTLDSRWYFDGDSHVSGNGNILDLDATGTLWIRSGTTLYLTNLKLKGLGRGRIVFEDPTSQLYLSQVEIEMERDYTVTTGGIYIEGPTTIVTKNRTLTLDTNASMTVDGMTLWYDTLEYWDGQNIQPLVTADVNVHNKYLTCLHNAVVRQKNWYDMVRTHSAAYVYNHRISSNTLAYNYRTNSNALAYNNRVNSNALIRDYRVNSNALMYNYRANSNAFMHNYRMNSNAFMYNHRVDSNALLYGIRTNSNALVFNNRITSNAVMPLYLEVAEVEVTGLIDGHILNSRVDDLYTKWRTNSQAIMYNFRTNTNALDYLVRQHSNSYQYLFRTHSNAYAYNYRMNSNALTYNFRTNSNILAYNFRVNSNAVDDLNARFTNINGPHGEINASPCILPNDLYVDASNPLTVNVDSVIDGAGHSMWFARGQVGMFRVLDGIEVTLTNVVLKGFDDAAVQLGTDASITFGDGVVIELADATSLRRNWTFAGTGAIHGFGNKLDLSYFNLGILQPGSLVLHDVVVDGLKDNNLRCIGNNAILTLRGCDLLLSNNYTLTAGKVHFEQDVVVTGTNTLTYASPDTSEIATQSTLLLDTGVNFAYAPSLSNNRDLFAMAEETSKLYLNGCSLSSTTTGLRLTKGTLILDNKNSIYAAGSTLSSGIAFGDGNAGHNLTIYVMPGASLDVKTGCLNYANVQ